MIGATRFPSQVAIPVEVKNNDAFMPIIGQKYGPTSKTQIVILRQTQIDRDRKTHGGKKWIALKSIFTASD